MHRLKVLTAALAAVWLLNGCSMMLTDYERPALPQTSSSFARAERFAGQQLDARYWQLFHDDIFDQYAEKALTANYDLNNAYLNVRAALAQLGLTNTNLNPTANAGADANVSRELRYGSRSESAGSSLNLSYELDLFGRLAAQRRSAAESFQASGFDYWAMRLSVISSLGSAYWQYAYAKEALALGEEELMTSQRRLSLIESMYRAGAANGLEYDTAKVNHLTVMDTVEQRRQQLYAAQTALNLLLQQTPDAPVQCSALSAAAIPDFALALPAELLARRPDLMAAEARLRAALADTDEARLNFFPQFTLSAGLTAGDGAAIARFLSDPVGSLGAAVTFPFLNFNQLSYQEESAMVERDRAQLNFVNTYLTALQETADAVDAVNYYRQAVQTMAERERLARRNYMRCEARYRLGASTLTELLDASDTLRAASISLLSAKRDNLIYTLQLMTAVGGDTKVESVNQLLNSAAQQS